MVKKDLFGCFRIEEIRDNDNETGLKERGVIEMSTTVLPLRDARSFVIEMSIYSAFHIRDARSLSLIVIYLPKPSRGSLTNMGKNSGNVMNVFVVPFSLLSTRLKSKLLVLLRLCL